MTKALSVMKIDFLSHYLLYANNISKLLADAPAVEVDEGGDRHKSV